MGEAAKEVILFDNILNMLELVEGCTKEPSRFIAELRSRVDLWVSYATALSRGGLDAYKRRTLFEQVINAFGQMIVFADLSFEALAGLGREDIIEQLLQYLGSRIKHAHCSQAQVMSSHYLELFDERLMYTQNYMPSPVLSFVMGVVVEQDTPLDQIFEHVPFGQYAHWMTHVTLVSPSKKALSVCLARGLMLTTKSLRLIDAKIGTRYAFSSIEMRALRTLHLIDCGVGIEAQPHRFLRTFLFPEQPDYALVYAMDIHTVVLDSPALLVDEMWRGFFEDKASVWFRFVRAIMIPYHPAYRGVDGVPVCFECFRQMKHLQVIDFKNVF